ncbi:molybdate ABC transporter substrate-binding protein [Staphylococcus massiliensis]|uniref:molybdate ABC transporter substrate-binding protein n=1 Tax=Staphylococcus massiliensis TaxID=555791 RepID=UPI00030494FD|nr:molybdate ABC transporter substrate-binding protein [Staphylococcus massiliensis]MCG3399395.1 molybdate ABC transporter substrate-binding protein [Staphylococcus massiliensis]MCG3402504.1 molybdate ABC transporter substrate-binding protein [Staphylococcus massiliensis]MCG3411531.1 molybdate ABC transporter substrate-binding protein [Staphylococcus massiliensis]PNZ98763.1 molybdate ABC transporter substrate-binding protein [Staphylococcus massiliensis CCUG 55927]
MKGEAVMKRLLGIIMMMVVVLAGCTQSKDSQSSLQISAAASLSDVSKELKTAFNKEHPDIKVDFNYGGSGALRKQIETGAPVDVFMSANQKDVTALKDKDKVSKTYNYARNELALITHKDADIKQISDLDKDDRFAIGEVNTVPAGKYAKSYLEEHQLYDRYESNYVFAKDVRQVLNYVKRGNAQLGIVYETDLYQDGKAIQDVKKLENLPIKRDIVYQAGIVSDKTASEKWLTFLKSDEAKRIFKKYHFNV